jgi:tetratricopeptide (TPR) repeat protein
VADDLEQYVAGRPVATRPANPSRRFLLWCRRQPVVAGLALSLLTLFVAGLLLVLGQWKRAEAAATRADDERRRAETNLDRTEEILEDFCTRLGENRTGLQPVRRELLESALGHYKAMLAEREGDPRLRAGLAATHYRVGAVTATVGTREDALAAFEQARELFEALAADRPDDHTTTMRLAHVHMRIGLIQTGLSRLDAALASYGRARDLLTPMCADPDLGVEAARELGAVWSNTGNVYLGSGRPGEARSCYEAGVALREKLLERDPESRPDRHGLALALNNLGNVFPDGRKYHDRARGILEDLERTGRDEGVTEELARSLLREGNARCAERRWEEALVPLGRAREMLTKLIAAEPQVLDYRDTLAAVCRQAGHAHLQAGRREDAAACYAEALARCEELHRADPASTTYRRGEARSCFDLAAAWGRLGKTAESEALYVRARDHYRVLAVAEPRSADYHWSLALTLNNLAGRWEKSRPADARAAVREACDHGRTAFDLSPRESRHHDALANSYRIRGRLARQAGETEESVAAALARLQLDPEDAAVMVTTAGELALAAGLSDESRREEYGARAVRLLDEAARKGKPAGANLDTDSRWESLRGRDDFRATLARWNGGR